MLCCRGPGSSRMVAQLLCPATPVLAGGTLFFPLRTEQYSPDGKLILIEVRLAEIFNPDLGEQGYGSLITLFWAVADDLMTYFVNDSHRVTAWNSQEVALFFSPDFMRRQWALDTSVKTQAQVPFPNSFSYDLP